MGIHFNNFVLKKNSINWFRIIRLLIFILIVSILTIFHIKRLFYGVDVLDEAYYIAIPYRFVLGDIPFIDEISIHQTSSILIFPIVKIFYIATGSMSGIILAMRLVYLLAAAGVSVLIYRSVKVFTTLLFYNIMFISFLCILYIPFGIYTLSYNNIAILALTATMFLILSKLDSKNKFKKVYAAAGFFSAISILAYPPLIIFSSFYVLLFFFKKPILFKNKIIIYIIGLFIPLIFFLLFLIILGLPEIIHNMSYVNNVPQGGGINKLFPIFKGFFKNFPISYFTVPYLLISAVLYRFLKKRILTLVIIPPIFFPLFGGVIATPFGVIFFTIFYGLLLPYLMLFTDKSDPLPGKILWYLWIPSFFAGFITAYSSANGFANFSIGFFPATIATTLLLIHLLSSIKLKNILSFEYVIVLIAIIPLIIFSIYNYNFVYGEGKINENLKYHVKSGPYYGLVTTSEKQSFLINIQETIQNNIKTNETKIFIFNFFPAGYLFTSSRSASNLVWLSPKGWYGSPRSSVLKYLKDPVHSPSLVIRTKKVPNLDGSFLIMPNNYDELDAFIIFNYSIIEDNEWYSVLTKRVDK